MFKLCIDPNSNSQYGTDAANRRPTPGARGGTGLWLSMVVIVQLASLSPVAAVEDRASPIDVSTEGVKLPAGFRVELMYPVPAAEQGSWVAITVDSADRLVTSDQDGHLYRIQVGERTADTKVEKLDVEVGHAQGLLYAYNSLYVTANLSRQESNATGRQSGLYRIWDRDGNDRFDDVQLLQKFRGNSEHGPHGLQLGPDGRIYIVSGNTERLPDSISPDSPLQNWADDLLVPSGQNKQLPAGWIARIDSDGNNWELLCGGLRNPYDIAFHPHGELFTWDADSETDIGTSWYRPTRINHLVSGGEYGWRYDMGPWLPYGKWPDYYPDSVGSVVDIGVGSPAGLVFGTGAHFPARYQTALYSCDWAWGKIYAVHLQPHGASYRATFETFLEGRSLPITDVIIHPDGNMYFTTGGRKAASGLFRVRYVGQESVEPAEPLDDPDAQQARQLRRRLERFHGREHPNAVMEAWPHLGNLDRAIRYAARVAVEHQPLAAWSELALQETRHAAVIQAAIALARTANPELQGDVLQRLDQLPLDQFSEEQLLSALRAYGLVLVRLGGKSPEVMTRVRSRLEPLFPSSSQPINRELCRLLVYLEAPRIVEQSLSLLRSSQTQAEQLFYLSTLVQRRIGWTLDQRREFFRWLNVAQTTHRSGADALGRRELDGRLTNILSGFRASAVQQLSEQERESVKDVIEEGKSTGLVGLESARRALHNWQPSDLLPLMEQVNHNRSFENGRSAYQAAQCAKCHRLGNQGGTTGPDITAVGKRFDPTYILEAMLLPSKVIPDRYRTEIIHTEDGSVYTGRVVHEDGQQLQLRSDPSALKLTEIDLDSIEIRSLSNTSEMPAGLVNILSKTEILDLIAYLRAGGDQDDAAFAVERVKTAAD